LQAAQDVNARITIRHLGMLGALLAALAWLCHFFEIGGPGFVKLMLLTVPAFAVHAVLPLRFRLPWFLLASLASILLVLGPVDAFWLVTVVCGFIAVCHLPVALRWRVILLIAGAVGLAYLKASGWVRLAPWSHAAWPIIASILMFRLIIYLYDLHHEKTRPPLMWSLSYFFMLPNVCFPLFPVVDFKKFRSTYYSEPAAAIYERGLSWIFRGVYQLILYRIVYQFLVLPPSEVLSTGQLVQFMLSSYLLYLRVSGLFHLIVGLLLMFGFNLPETHKKYYLASSFNDFWRRINIYWKDFMMKIFYYPVYFKVKSLGPTPALVIATVVVFLCTWALHAYQWFWIRGTLLFELHDLLFWATLGALVVLNSLREIKHGRNRSTARAGVFTLATFAHACRVMSTFTSLCLIWSMWSSDSLEQWILMWRAAGPSAAVIVAVIPAFYMLAIWAEKRAAVAPSKPKATVVSAGSSMRTIQPQPVTAHAFSGAAVLVLAGLVIASWPGAPLVSGEISRKAQLVRSEQLNRRDQNRMERGYYEHLMNANRHSALWEAVEEKPLAWDNLEDIPATRHPQTILLTEFAPHVDITFKNRNLRTNRWGFRDQEYDTQAPANTTRVVFMGSSHTMGSGVDNDQIFEQLLERHLNSSPLIPGRHYEILNFGMSAYSAIQQLYALESKVAQFKPDVVVYFQIEEDERFILRNLSMAIRAKIDIPHDFVKQIVDELHLTAASSDEEIRQSLTPHANRILAWAETRFIERIGELGAQPVCIMLPRVQARPERGVVEERQRVVKAAGCSTISLVDVYDGYNEKELRVASWDRHPNSLGHELIAAKLFKEFKARPALLGDANPKTFMRSQETRWDRSERQSNNSF
jgi:D-alanyl-lipoteichoic acid acyltransferase DltB (MBOAT superfamily)